MDKETKKCPWCGGQVEIDVKEYNHCHALISEEAMKKVEEAKKIDLAYLA